MNASDLMAGKELDALVAEKVMGWTWDRPHSEGGVLGPCEGDPRFNWCAEWDERGFPDWLPKFSTDISDAWEVVEKMERLGWNVLIAIDDGRYGVGAIRKSEAGPNWFECPTVYEQGESVQTAVCLAALSAVGAIE